MSQTSLRVIGNEEAGLGKPLPVRLSRIERFEEQPRRFFDDRSLAELADDIQLNKQKTPVRVCKHSSKGGVFVLIGGERRWRAFHIIAERTNTDPIVNCLIDTVYDERHHFREAFFDNLLREDLIPADEAAAYERLYQESRGESHYAKVVEVAGLAKKSATHVENYLQLARVADGVKLLMDPRRKKEEQLGTSIAIEIAKSTKDPALQLELAKEAVERNLGLVEARTYIQVKTGKTGYGVGGRLRQPKDDYRMFATYLANTLRGIRNFQHSIDLDGLYYHRDDEDADRKRDAATIRLIVDHLNDALKKVGGQPPKKGDAS